MGNFVFFRFLVVIEIREVFKFGVGDDERRIVVTVAGVVLTANGLGNKRPGQKTNDRKTAK
jgi:hypothetical protein